jgi:hypothetical protein
VEATDPFQGGGRTLAAWLPELVSVDHSTRQAAGDAMFAMYCGVSSVHDELTEAPDAEPQQAAWRIAVRNAIEMPEFPPRSFFLSAAARLVGAHDDYMRQIMQSDPQYERVCERIDGRLDAVTNEQGLAIEYRRLGRAMCAAIERVCKSETPNFEATSLAYFMLQWVIEAAGPAILEAPEAIWMLLESRGMHFIAEKALVEAGPQAASLFLPYYVEKFEATYSGASFNESKVLASIGRGNREVIAISLRAIETGGERLAWEAASTLYHMSVEACSHEEAIPELLRLTAHDDAERRAAAAFALGGVARNSDDAISRLLQLTLDESVNYQGGYIVAGYAATALGEIRRHADCVVPRLAEMLATFQEFDPDMEYGGRHARIAEALLQFGPAAAAATSTIIERLETYLDGNEDLEDASDGELTRLLRAIGPEARSALPVLRSLLATVVRKRRKDGGEAHEMDEAATVGIRDEAEGDDDDFSVEADLRKTIQALERG